jgi:hypothetical protein
MSFQPTLMLERVAMTFFTMLAMVPVLTLASAGGF